jgi:hypothetical protein
MVGEAHRVQVLVMDKVSQRSPRGRVLRIESRFQGADPADVFFDCIHPKDEDLILAILESAAMIVQSQARVSILHHRL